MNPTFEDTVAAAIADCPPGAVLLAAVSGGADSTAMLAALAAVRSSGSTESRAAFSLRCIHIEHGIRPEAESRGDAEFVRSLCKKFRIPCRIISIAPGKIQAAAKDRGIGIEAAARLYRHRAWLREARRLEAKIDGPAALPVRILTAHTADDMLETTLMRILRGSGPSGLAAMPARRGPLLRPLITLSRRDVLNYLADKNITWREDSTNTDTQFLRNRIRHCLIPHLNQHFPQWRTTLTALAETQSHTASFIRDEATRRICWQPTPHSPRSIPHSLHTNAEIFFAQPAIIREEALFQGIDKLLSDSRKTTLSRGIKRANIRHFSEGKITAVDLGLLDLRRKIVCKRKHIVLSVKKNRPRKGVHKSGISID